jgi:predicted flap endonuclease-1-like 5' DNA nuclease
MTPDFTPVARLMGMQARMAMQTSESVMRLAYLPWKSWSTSFGSLGVQQMIHEAAEPTEVQPEQPLAAAPAQNTEVATPAEVIDLAPTQAESQSTDPAPESAQPEADTVAEAAEVQPEPAPKSIDEAVVTPSADPTIGQERDLTETPVKPTMRAAPRDDAADDLTLLKGVGPKLAVGLNNAGIYHFDQIAAWNTAEVAWVDENIAGVRGRASRDGWVEQAKSLTTT